MISVNETAPDFTAAKSDGNLIRLSDYENKKNVVLFFYPKDFSFACTRQACQFRDTYDDLRDLNCELFGISYDPPERHREFINAYNLPFELISDEDKSIARNYGVMRLGGYLPFVKRVTFVIDNGRRIRNVIHHEFKMENHIEEVRQTLRIIENEKNRR